MNGSAPRAPTSHSGPSPFGTLGAGPPLLSRDRPSQALREPPSPARTPCTGLVSRPGPAHSGCSAIAAASRCRAGPERATCPAHRKPRETPGRGRTTATARGGGLPPRLHLPPGSPAARAPQGRAAGRTAAPSRQLPARGPTSAARPRRHAGPSGPGGRPRGGPGRADSAPLHRGPRGPEGSGSPRSGTGAAATCPERARGCRPLRPGARGHVAAPTCFPPARPRPSHLRRRGRQPTPWRRLLRSARRTAGRPRQPAASLPPAEDRPPEVAPERWQRGSGGGGGCGD